MCLVNKYIHHPVYGLYFSLLMIILFSTSCIDINEYQTVANGKVNVSLKVSGGQIEAGGEEDGVYTLRMIDFYTDMQGRTGVNNWLVYNKATESATNKSINLSLQAGNHAMYFIANAENRSISPSLSESLANVTTENQLKDILLSYNIGSESKMPMHPFVMTSSKIEKTINTNGQIFDIVLNYSLVKVNYTFNLDANNPVFKNKDFELKSIQFKNLSKESNLMISAETQDGKTFDSEVYTIKSASEDPQSTWPYTGVFYIPECLYSAEAIAAKKYTHMEIIGGFKGTTATAKYIVNLTGDEVNKDNKITPRGREYIIVGTVKSLGLLEGLEATLYTVPWTLESFDLYLGNTLLWLSKTSAGITSLTTDFINYRTNAEKLEIEIEELPSGFKPIIATPSTNENGKIVVFEMNPEQSLVGIDPSLLKGSVRVKFKANNLHKIVDVAYNLEPTLIVTPKERTIYLETSVYTTTVEYFTNLGGVEIKNISSSGITVSPTTLTGNKGEITITANNRNIETPEDFTFDVYPLTGYPELKVEVKVTVRPEIKGWIVHFRAINDKGNVTGNISTWTMESDEWDDGWLANTSTHYSYIYTQEGGNNVADKVWKFTGDWPGTPMIKDLKNPGWYYYLLKNEPKANGGSSPVSRPPNPGQTLVMFANEYGSYIRHRYPFNNEPGIPLFDFADKDAWLVYDPTTDFYEFYDNKPIIQDVTYTVYYKSLTGKDQPTKFRWYRKYGIASNNTGDQFTIQSAASSDYNYPLSGPDAEGYYKGQIKLKAWSENMTKAIEIEFSNGESGMLYNGGDYSTSTTEASGTFIEGSGWAKGKSDQLKQLPNLASGYRRIFYYNSGNWLTPSIYAWIGSSNIGLFPGVTMKKWFGKWYYYDISDTFNTLIFSNAGSSQTGNISFNMSQYQLYYKGGW